jgi:type IV secretion system protein VirB5
MNLFKKKSSSDERRSGESLQGGRRKGESQNPYVSARRTWNDYTGSQIASRRMWQAVAIGALMIVLACVGGLIKVASQSKFIPYIVEVDSIGKTVAAGPANQTSVVDPRIVKAAVSDFISDARLVTPDIALQRKAVFRVYSRLEPTEPATKKMGEYLNGSPDSNPFARASKEMVSTEIKTVLPQTTDTWQIDWVETTRDRQGGVIGQPVFWRALVTVYIAAPAPGTKEEQLILNPLGVYVRDYSWQKLQ